MVIALHLTKDAAVQPAAAYAVCGFYVVSGYLMTAVLNDNYRGRPLAFWGNRFLRLFPMYYLVGAAMALILIVRPIDDDLWTRAFGWHDFFGNLTIVWFEFYDGSRDFRLVPSAWSVAVEIVDYFLLWAFAARHMRCSVASSGSASDFIWPPAWPE